jgi:mannitol operon repressor
MGGVDNMLLSTAEDIAAFVSELRRESDRGLALVAAALIDEKLADTLKAFFCQTYPAARLLREGNAALGTFSSKIELCFALGLIDSHEHSEIELIRKVRNEFAHSKHGLDFRGHRIQGLCASLTSDLPEDADYPTTDPRFRFTNASVAMVLRLYHRPEWVALERREAKEWLPKDTTKWRSIADDPPPLNHPILVMGRGRKRFP